MSKEEYNRIKPGHYYIVMQEGSKIQQFWHNTKFSEIKKNIATKNAKILDIGSGPGCFLSLIQRDFKLAIGFDISFSQLRFARDKVPEANWVVGNALTLPFKNASFDYIILSEVIEHLPKSASFGLLKSIYLLLKPSGKLLLTTPNYHSIWPLLELCWNFVSPVKYLEQHINKYNLKSLKQALLKAGFSEVNMSTSFFLSSFIALFSKSLAEKVYRLEQKHLSSFGSILIAEVSK